MTRRHEIPITPAESPCLTTPMLTLLRGTSWMRSGRSPLHASCESVYQGLASAAGYAVSRTSARPSGCGRTPTA